MNRPGSLRAGLLALLVCAAPTVVVPAVHAQDAGATSLQSRVRAAFLFNFARFTEWPAAERNTQSFDFCLFEDSDLEQALRATLQGKQIDGKVVAVRRLEDPEDTADCHLLYLPAQAQRSQDRWLQSVAGQAVLTVSEGRAFPREGGMIGLYLAERRLRFSINPQAVHDAGMQMSSRLLSLAEIAGETP